MAQPKDPFAASIKPAASARPRRRVAAPKPARPATFRLLPLVIFAAALMLSVRVGDIWKGVSAPARVQVTGDLEAEQPARGRGPVQPPAQVPPDSGQQQATAPAPASSAPGGATAANAGTGDATPGGMSQTEMDVLQKLVQRRDQLDARERDIARREDLLKAAEDQIDRKVAELKSLQSTIQSLLRQYNEQEDSKMISLVKIYENMKPKEAAKIFEQLDMQILLDVIERMKEQRVAPILAEMDPAKARTVTSELAQRRQMPLPKCAANG